MSAERERNAGRKEFDHRTPHVFRNGGGLRVRRNAGERRQDFRETAGKEFSEHVFQFFRTVGSEGVGEVFFPCFEVFRSVRNEFYRVCRSFRNVFESDAGRKGEYRGSGDSEVREHGRAVRKPPPLLILKFGGRKRKPGQFRAPRFERDERRKRRRERSYGMSERFRESVAGAVGTRFRIRGSSGGENHGIEIFRFGFSVFRVSHFEAGAFSDHGFDLGSKTEVRFRERAFENRHDVRSFVGNGKRAEVVLDLNGTPPGFEPFPRFFRRKRSERFFEKVRSSRIFGEEFLFRSDSGSDVASPTPGNGDFFSHLRVRVENGHARGRNPFFHYRRAGHHAGGAGSNYCDFHCGSVNAYDNTRERRDGKIKGP